MGGRTPKASAVSMTMCRGCPTDPCVITSYSIHYTKLYDPAEEYHQHYYRKNPIRYKYYRYGCGRDWRACVCASSIRLALALSAVAVPAFVPALAADNTATGVV